MMKRLLPWVCWATVQAALIATAISLPARAQDTGYFAQKTYTSSGAATYAVPFPYIHQADVQVYDNQVAYMGTVTWTNSTTISLSPVITTGHTVLIKRVTPSATATAVFNGGALSSTDLNRNQAQALYVGQEAMDRSAEANTVAADAQTAAASASSFATAASASATSASSAASSAAASAAAAQTWNPANYIAKAGITSGTYPSTGQIGERLCAQMWSSGSPAGCATNATGGVSMTTTANSNVTSLSLSAGYWLLFGEATCLPTSATVGIVNASLSPTSGSQLIPGSLGYAFSDGISAGNGFTETLGPVPVNISSTTTYFLVLRCDFPSGSVKGYGSIAAVRIG